MNFGLNDDQQMLRDTFARFLDENSSMARVRKAQVALNDKGYNVAVDGRMGPNTEGAVRSFQEKNGLAQSGTLDDETLNALGVKS